MLVFCVRMEVYLKICVLTLSKKRMIGYGFNTVGLSGRIKGVANGVVLDILQ